MMLVLKDPAVGPGGLAWLLALVRRLHQVRLLGPPRSDFQPTQYVYPEDGGRRTRRRGRANVFTSYGGKTTGNLAMGWGTLWIPRFIPCSP